VKQKINFFIIYYLPVIAWASLIFKLSSGTVPSASAVYWQDFVVKKLAHVTFFGFLSFLIYRALVASGVDKKKAVITAIVLTILYGATDEFHQSFTQGRESRLRDIGFDTLGSVIITTGAHKFLEKSKKWQKKLL
jgi:VanZ family protein